MVGFAAGFVVEAVTTTAVPESIFAGAGFTLGFFGLLGLYPSVADRSPGLARVGAICAVLGAVGFIVTFVTGIADVLQIAVPGWLSSLVILNIVGLVLGYLAFGVASLRTGARSRLFGALLLAPAVIFSLNFVRVILRGGPGSENVLPEVSAVLALGQAIALLGIGYTLRTEADVVGRAGSSTDSLV